MRERCGRNSGRRVLLSLVACGAFLGAAPAWGQQLNFDAAGVFEAGKEKTVAALRDALLEEVKKSAASPVAGTPIALAQGRVRELAAGLLEAGSSFGEAGSVHVLIGRRLAAGRAEIDETLRRLGGDDQGVARLKVFLDECPADGALLPREAEDLDRLLARVFTPIAGRPGARARTDAWPIEGLSDDLGSEGAFAATVERAAKVPGVTGDAVRALEACVGELTGNEAKATRQLVVQAAGAVENPVRWLGSDAHASLGAMFNAAAQGMAAPASRAGAKTDLVRLALVGDVLRRIDREKLTARQARTLRTAGVALARDLTPGSHLGDDAIVGFRTGMVLLESYESVRWNDNRRLVREARPLWRQTEIHGRRARDELIEALSRITPTTPALSDPGVLGGFAGVTRIIADARGLCAISAWLAGADDVRTAAEQVFGSSNPDKPGERRADAVTKKEDRTRRQIGVRLLPMAAKLKSARTHDETVAAVRELASGLQAWFPVTGEQELGKGILGDGAKEVLRTIQETRDRWLTTWAAADAPAVEPVPAPTTSDADRLALLAELAEIAANTRTLTDMIAADARSGARAWPGFELSRGAMEIAVSPLRTDLPGASAFMLAGDYDTTEKSLVGIRGHAKIVATLTGLEHAATSRGLVRRSVIDELASPPASLPTLHEDLTPGVWLGSARDSVAMVCRGLEEYADAIKAGERERSRALLRFIVAECDRVQRALGMR